MKPRFEIVKGWTEVIIDGDCEFAKFYKVASVLETHFHISFTNQLNDFDSVYWDFLYNESELVLFYNIYDGVTIFPRAFKEASKIDNAAALEIGTLLFQQVIQFEWSNHKKGKTINTIGPANGIIIMDIVHLNGARIIVEKECGTIPFIITFSVNKIITHTHPENDWITVNNLIIHIQRKINTFLELYDVPKKRRDTYWKSKQEKQLLALSIPAISGEGEKPSKEHSSPTTGK
jgi:hypothetical protein